MEIEVPVEKNTVSNKKSLGISNLINTDRNNSGNLSGLNLDSFGRSESESSADSLLLENNEPLPSPDTGSTFGNTSSTSRFGVPSSKSDVGNDDPMITNMSHKLPRMLKVAVVGESTAGKTCICENICADYPTFSEKYRLTCGVEIFAKTLNVVMKSNTNQSNNNADENTDTNNQSSRLVGRNSATRGGSSGTSRRDQQQQQQSEKVNLILLDSSGKDLYVDVLPKYWGKLDGFVLVIDLTSKNALENAIPWLELAQQSLALNDSKNSKEIPTIAMKTSIMIGNKSDLKNQCVIKSTTAQEFANKYGLQYFECSVKQNLGIQEAFQHLAKSGISLISDKNSSTKLAKQLQK